MNHDDGKRGRRHGQAKSGAKARPTSTSAPRTPVPRTSAPRTSAKVSEIPAGDRQPGRLRIAKAMARAGLCSRREAERWIAEGRVAVNGKVLATPAFEVSEQDTVLVDGKPLPEPRDIRLWRYHKPRGLVTTHRDPEGRPTVFEAVPARLGRVISIGRLDFNTEGLLLLTTSGALARHLELPATGLLRRYRVRARGTVTQEALDALKSGVEIDGLRYGPVEATLDSGVGTNIWLTVGLREGKNREVRKILQHLGLEVGRLIRISYGPFRLADLKPGEVEPVRRRVLAEQLGPRVAAELGLSGDDDDELPAAPPPRRKEKAAAAPPSGTTESKAASPRRPRSEGLPEHGRLVKRGQKWVRVGGRTKSR